MAHRTLIRNADVVLPGGIARISVLLEDGRIAALDAPPTLRADETINASGLHLLPGAIDAHVHFRDPGLTHKEDLATGSRACAAGGVTSFLDMPNTVPQTVTVKALQAKLALAARKCVVNYGFYVGATRDNLDQLAEASRDPAVASRTPGIKVFLGSSTGNMLLDDAGLLERLFAETELPIAAHCEDEATVRANRARLCDERRARAPRPGGRTGPAEPNSSAAARTGEQRSSDKRLLSISDHSRIRDRTAAVRAARQAIGLAQRHGRRLHVLHVSTAEEAALMADAGPLVTSEACPHHVFLDTSDYARLGTRAQMNPALKTASDRAALWNALKAGAIDMIATDHAPHTLEEKRVPYPDSPSGVPAVEVVLPLLLDQVNQGRCTLEEVAQWTSGGPARVWSIVGKGRIEEGFDADLVLVDLSLRREVRNADQWTKCGWTPWHRAQLSGWPVRTWVGGRTVFKDGQVDPEPGGQPLAFERSRERRRAGAGGADRPGRARLRVRATLGEGRSPRGSGRSRRCRPTDGSRRASRAAG